MAAKKRTATRKRRAATAARPKRHKPETLRLRSVAPGLTVGDIDKSVAWYRDVLGFHTGDRWESDGKLMGIEMVAGRVVFMLTQDDWKKGRDRVKGEGVRVYCATVQDIDLLARRARSQGAKLTQEPSDQPWGMRDFALNDPDGYKITIGADLKK